MALNDWFKFGKQLAKDGKNLPSSHGKSDAEAKNTAAGFWHEKKAQTPPPPPKPKQR